jgi:uncharacterized RDD family membrane protein YckC
MVLESVVSLLKDEQDFSIDGIAVAVGYFLWSFSIRFISIAATYRTVGMTLMGIIVVTSSRGRRPHFFNILVRQAFQILVASIPGLNMLFFLCALIRRDGRFLHDIISCTGTVYSWDVRTASLRVQYRDKKSEDDEENQFYELQDP